MPPLWPVLALSVIGMFFWVMQVVVPMAQVLMIRRQFKRECAARREIELRWRPKRMFHDRINQRALFFKWAKF